MPPIIALAAIMCSSAIVIVSIIARTVSQQRRRQAPPAVDDEVMRRLDRIEHMLESVALEQERAGESSRFLVRVLAARTDGGELPAIHKDS